MEISVVSKENIDGVWLMIKDYAKGAADYTYGRFTANDIRTGLKTKNQQLWIAHEDEEALGFVVTQISDYPQMRSLIMHFTGGKELPKWKSMMLEELQNFAYNNGCDVIESQGRKGWGKVFKDDGFKECFMFYELPVKGEA